MRNIQLLILSATLVMAIVAQFSIAVDEPKPSKSPEQAPGVPVWLNNKMTPEQPFAARVKAIGASWVDYTLLLEEITTKGEARSCIATIGFQQITYKVMPTADAHALIRHPHHHATFYKKPIAVNEFQWDGGLYKIGRSYKEKDCLRKWYVDLKKAKE